MHHDLIFARIQRCIGNGLIKLLIIWYKLVGPPRILIFRSKYNIAILKAFGAKIGDHNVRIFSPITLHGSEGGYGNLTIEDDCVLNGNNYLDLYARITLEQGASLGPGVIIMTHNAYNSNKYLESYLAHTVGKKDVVIKKGAGIKAGALIAMGVTIGENAVVAGNALVNHDVPPHHLVSGTPAKVILEIV